MNKEEETHSGLRRKEAAAVCEGGSSLTQHEDNVP